MAVGHRPGGWMAQIWRNKLGVCSANFYRLRALYCLSARAHAMATRAASVRDAAIKTGETCATKLQDGLTTTTQTFAA